MTLVDDREQSRTEPVTVILSPVHAVHAGCISLTHASSAVCHLLNRSAVSQRMRLCGDASVSFETARTPRTAICFAI